MPEYKRAFVPGGTFFFTLVTYRRRPILTTPIGIRSLRLAMGRTRASHDYTLDAIVVLPDHLHCIWTLPDGDPDFSTRWRLIKSRFTRSYLEAGGTDVPQSTSRSRQGERGVWQRRFWERTIRDEQEYEALCDYIHSNPIKHGLVECAHAWPYSSFHRFVRLGFYDKRWCCSCEGKKTRLMESERILAIVGE